jgi:hypothetical protein
MAASPEFWARIACVWLQWKLAYPRKEGLEFTWIHFIFYLR